MSKKTAKKRDAAPQETPSGPLQVDVRGLGVDLSLRVDLTAPLPRKLSEIGCGLVAQFGRLLEAHLGDRAVDPRRAGPMPAPPSPAPPGRMVDETPVSCTEDLLRKYGPRGIQQIVEPLISFVEPPSSWPEGAWDTYLHQLAVAMVDLESALRMHAPPAASEIVHDTVAASPAPIATVLGSNYTATEMRDAAARVCRRATDDTLTIWAEEIAKARATREPS